MSSPCQKPLLEIVMGISLEKQQTNNSQGTLAIPCGINAVFVDIKNEQWHIKCALVTSCMPYCQYKCQGLFEAAICKGC